MTYMTQSELSACYFAHDKGAALLEMFLIRANKINDARRREVPNAYGQPYISDELSTTGWYMDTPTTLVIPELWGGDSIELPVEVLTGEVSAEAYVTHLWIEYEQKKKLSQESEKTRRLKDLKRYAEMYPEEAKEIVNGEA